MCIGQRKEKKKQDRVSSNSPALETPFTAHENLSNFSPLPVFPLPPPGVPPSPVSSFR